MIGNKICTRYAAKNVVLLWLVAPKYLYLFHCFVANPSCKQQVDGEVSSKIFFEIGGVKYEKNAD